MLNKRLIVGILTVVLLFLGIFSFAQGRNNNETTGGASIPVITLKGDKEVTIEVGSQYEDAGATATDEEDGDLTEEIVINNPVDTSVVANYTITYDVTDSDDNDAVQVTRTVKVVDTTIPVITMIGGNVTIKVGGNFVDPGATATDNYDENITANIVATGNVNPNVIGTYTVTYNVTDANGNAAVPVQRMVFVVDDELPLISLNGDAEVTIEVGDTYVDAGATAVDNYDGDITDKIVIEGNVDTTTVGTYTITYNVTDSEGNAAIPVTRTVRVVDTTPADIDVDYSTKEITKGNVTVVLTSNEPLQPVIDWVLSTDKLTLTRVFTSNVDLLVTVKDLYNNETGVNVKIENIDKVAPIFDGLVDKGHTTGNITINVIDDNLDSIKVYNQDINKTFNKNNGDILTEEATYRLTATDKAGNKTEIWVAIDRTDPTISGVTDNEAYNQDVTVKVFDKFLMTVTVNKDGNVTTYGRDQFNHDSKKENYEIELPISEQGTYTIIGTDKVGNSKEVTFVIDKSAPNVEVNYISNKSKDIEYNKIGDRVAIEFKTNEPIDLITSAVTIAGQTATLDTEKVYAPNVTNTYTYQIIVDSSTPEGQVTFTLDVVDLAGNAAPTLTLEHKDYKSPRKYTAKIIIDKTLPQVTSFNQEYVESEDAIKVTIQYSEPVTGFAVGENAWRSLDNNTYYTYYDSTQDVTINFEDLAKNANSYSFSVDKDAPLITLDYVDYSNTYRPQHRRKVTVSDALNSVDASSLKYIWATDRNIAIDVSGFASFTNGTDLYSPLEATGTYYLVIVAKDIVGNTAVLRSNGFKLDNSVAEITFGTDGNSAPAKSHSTTVSASDDESGIKYIKYLWNTSNTAPTYEELNTSGSSITNGEEVTLSGETGEYYLWVLAVSNSELSNDGYPYTAPSIIYDIKGSQTFVLDNQAPIFNSFEDEIEIDLDEDYEDVKPTAIDSVDNDVTVTSSGTVNTSIAGKYIITYTATDDVDNKATATRTVYVRPVITAPADYEIAYNSTYVPKTATVKLSATVTKTISPVGVVNTNAAATYPTTYNYTLDLGNGESVKATEKNTNVTVKVIDSAAPAVSYIYIEGFNSVFRRKIGVYNVKVTDTSEIVELKYVWHNHNNQAPNINSWSNFHLSGDYSYDIPSWPPNYNKRYLWIYVKDIHNNSQTYVSEYIY